VQVTGCDEGTACPFECGVAVVVGRGIFVLWCQAVFDGDDDAGCGHGDHAAEI